MKILAVDVGGTHVKILATGQAGDRFRTKNDSMAGFGWLRSVAGAKMIFT